jgi:hypothetical protein
MTFKNYFYSKSYSNPNIIQIILCDYAHKSYLSTIYSDIAHVTLFLE